MTKLYNICIYVYYLIPIILFTGNEKTAIESRTFYCSTISHTLFKDPPSLTCLFKTECKKTYKSPRGARNHYMSSFIMHFCKCGVARTTSELLARHWKEEVDH